VVRKKSIFAPETPEKANLETLNSEKKSSSESKKSPSPRKKHSYVGDRKSDSSPNKHTQYMNHRPISSDNVFIPKNEFKLFDQKGILEAVFRDSLYGSTLQPPSPTLDYKYESPQRVLTPYLGKPQPTPSPDRNIFLEIFCQILIWKNRQEGMPKNC
jgi:hypothetical protein